MKPFESSRFLEIGEVPFVKEAFPDQTDFFQTSPRRSGVEGGSPIGMAALIEKLKPGAVDLIFCQAPSLAPWYPHAIVRTFFNRRLFQSRPTLHRPYGPQLLRLFRNTPLAVLDLSDSPHLERAKLPLLDRATLYFKRELPTDEWKLLSMTATPTQPSQRFRHKARFIGMLAKLRPISLGLPRGAASDLPTGPVAKTVDIFFAGTVADMPVRQRALGELSRLKAEGFVIDIPEGKIGRQEFYRRCAAAWVTLSPEGFGWDCFRHYEASACGSVPIMNLPTIRRYAPHTDGLDALFFPPEQGGLARVVHHAFSDRDKLVRMAAAAKAHVAAHHTTEAIVRYAAEEALAASASLK